jgi:hypothetical protein
MAKKNQINGKETKEYNFTRKPIFNIHHQADPLFAAKCHPSEPVFITGTATGHVQAYRYDIDKLLEIYEDQDKFPYDISCVKYDDFDDDSIISQWHTKRHKKSCRDLCFDLPSGGEKVHTVGAEGVIKTADVKTGQVINKFLSSKDNTFNDNKFEIGTYTKCVSVPGKNFLLVGDESGNLMCHDTRSKHLQLCYKPFKKLHLGEGINSINYCWPKSDYKIITTGSTTVCELDLRKPEEPLHKSEDQEDEVLCAAWLDQQKQETMICGMGDVVTTWKPNMNQWNDQISRIRVAKGETVECLISAMDADSRFMYGGCSNGHIAKIDIVGGKVVERFLQHDPEEDDKPDEVLGLDLDYNYRLISFGTDGFKIWEDKSTGDDEGESEEKEEEEDISDSDDYKNTSDYESDSSDQHEERKITKEDEQNYGKEQKDDQPPRKKSLTESLKRRMESLGDQGSKKPKTSETSEINESDSDSEIGQEVPDSDDDNQFDPSASKTVELHLIRDQILERIDNPDFDANEKPSKKKKQAKKEKKAKAAMQEHGIRKFEGL